jgi:magnesium transporter
MSGPDTPRRPRPGSHSRHHLKKGVKRRTKPGSAPGTVTADPEARPTTIAIMGFGLESYDEIQSAGLNDISPMLDKFPVTWIDVTGLGNVETISELGRIFGFHPLMLEDIVNTHQRAKTEDYTDKLYMVVRMVTCSDGTQTESEQVSIVLGRNYVITFQERVGDCFEAVRNRVRKEQTRMRNSGADYLAYALIDAVIDGYFPVMERVGERIEQLEDQIILRPEASAIENLHNMKHELLAMRRAIWPHREMINILLRQENGLISPATEIYLRDCHDHAIQVMDILETYREISSSMVDIYLSSLSNRMNEIMKVLTIIATIFIPLSFVASLYGMNFDTEISPWNMPELKWVFGYPAALAVMAVMAGGLLYYFRRKGWLGTRKK